MVLKTFNVEEDTYNRFSEICRKHGISMSKQIELFMESQIGDIKEVKPEYLKKLKKIIKGKHHKFNTVSELRKVIEND